MENKSSKKEIRKSKYPHTICSPVKQTFDKVYNIDGENSGGNGGNVLLGIQSYLGPKRRRKRSFSEHNIRTD